MIITTHILVTDEEAEDQARLAQDPKIAIAARKWCFGAMDLETVIAAHEPVEFNGEYCKGQTAIMTDSGPQFTIKMSIKEFVILWKNWQDKRDFVDGLIFPDDDKK